MVIFLDCLPCFLRQVLDAARMTTDQAELHEVIMKDAIALISEYCKYKYSPEIGREIHQLIKKHTGVFDPYKEIKKKNIESALKVYPSLKRFLFTKP